MRIRHSFVKLLLGSSFPLTVHKGWIKRMVVEFSLSTLLNGHPENVDVRLYDLHLELKYTPASMWEEDVRKNVAYSSRSKQKILSGYFFIYKFQCPMITTT